MKRVFYAFTIISIVALATLRLSSAFFSDTETSEGNVLAAGAIDLLIDNTSFYNGQHSEDTSWQLNDLLGKYFFNFNDIKPSDWGEDTISLHVKDNPSWLCMDINLTSDDDNTCTDPENTDDQSCTEPNNDLLDGELGKSVNFIFWADDGDNVLENDEEELIFKQGTSKDLFTGNQWVLADSSGNIWNNTTDPLPGLETRYVGKAWCFGTLTPAPLQQDGHGDQWDPSTDNDGVAGVDSRDGGFLCDGSNLNNETQSDVLTADVNFTAIQSRNNENYLCGEEECHTEVYGDIALLDSEHTKQGTLKNGDPITDTNRTDPNNATGNPDWVPGTGTNFFSLGKGGYITLKFLNPVKDGPSEDLSFHEATNGRANYSEEKAEVYVSQDGNTFQSIGFVTSEPGGDGVTYLDISPSGYSEIQYVKLVDATDYTPHIGTADGYDLDAIDGVYGQCVQ